MTKIATNIINIRSVCTTLDCLDCATIVNSENHYLIINRELTSQSINIVGTQVNFNSNDGVAVHKLCFGNYYGGADASDKLNEIEKNLTFEYHNQHS
jgi:hypothetical protein